MLAVRGRTYAVAAAAVFAVVYAILGLFPVSAYIGVSSFLTFREVVSPLAGMLFGPAVGGASMVLGNFVDFALGKPVVFDFLDFVPDLVSAIVAGLAFTGRRKAAVGLPLVLLLWYSLDPASADVVNLGGVQIPFAWMHIVSIGVLLVALLLEKGGRLTRIAPAFVVAVTFASTMAGHLAGSIMYENVIFRLDGVIPEGGYQAFWTLVAYAYPPERILFTVAGSAVAYPVLRAVSRMREPPPQRRPNTSGPSDVRASGSAVYPEAFHVPRPLPLDPHGVHPRPSGTVASPLDDPRHVRLLPLE